MHELAVTKGLLKICLEEGEKHKIKKIRKINIVSKDTIAENTKINVEKIPVEIKCNECGYSGVLGKNNYVCPKCKGIVYEITKGKEFYLDTMEVD